MPTGIYSRSHLDKPLSELLEEKIERIPESGCWIWMGAIRSRLGGYGEIRRRTGLRILVHRLSWELHNGPIPKGMCICHRCDTPLCVNPHHLFLGTVSDNNNDTKEKGRFASGEKSPNAKLSNAAIAAIMKDQRQYKDIAKSFNVHPCQISRIRNGKAWVRVVKPEVMEVEA